MRSSGVGRWLVSAGLALIVILAERFMPVFGVDAEFFIRIGVAPVTVFGNAVTYLLLAHLILAFTNEKATRIVAALYVLAIAVSSMLEASVMGSLDAGGLMGGPVQEPGIAFTIGFVLTRVGAAAALWWIASLWTERGVGQGYLALPAALLLVKAPEATYVTVSQIANGVLPPIHLAGPLLTVTSLVAVSAFCAFRSEDSFPLPIAVRLVAKHPVDAIAMPVVLPLVLETGSGLIPGGPLLTRATTVVVAAVVCVRLLRHGHRSFRAVYVAIAALIPGAWIALILFNAANDPAFAELLRSRALSVSGPTITATLEGSAETATDDAETLRRRIGTLGGRAKIEEAKGRSIRISVTGAAPNELLGTALQQHDVALYGESEAQGALAEARDGFDWMHTQDRRYLKGPRKALEALIDELPARRDAQPLLDCSQSECVAYYVDAPPVLRVDDFEDATVGFDEYGSGYTVMGTLTAGAAHRFGRATAALSGRKLAIVVDGAVQSAPIVMGAINGGRVQITMGGYKSPDEQKREADALAAVLANGRLKATWKIVSVEQN